jgi:tetratricopeptide (TPR) repeat protein
LKQLAINFFIISAVLLAGCKGAKKTTTLSQKEKESGPKQFSKHDLDVNHFFVSANKEKLLGNTEDAILLFKKCLQIDPNNAAASYELSILAINAGDYQSAEAFSKKAYTLDPENEWYAVLYVETLQRNKKMTEAAKVYDNLLKKYPNRTDLYYDYADCYLRMNKANEAIQLYDELEKKIGVNPELSLQKEKIFIRIGKFEKAVEEINKLIAAYPEEAKYYGILAELYAANNKENEAIEIYNKALNIDQDNPYINLSFSEFYRQRKDYSKAFTYLEQAFNSEELDIDSKVKVLLSYFVVSEKTEELKAQSLSLCDLIIKAHPKEAKAFSIAGDFYYRDRKLEKAKEYFAKAVELDKSKYVIWNQLLIIESELQQFDEMIKHGKEALELFPNEPTIYLLLGIAYLQEKNPAEAVTVLKQGKNMIIDNKPLLGQFYANLGDAYYRTKQMELSDESYEEALKINPNDTYVLNNYAYYLSLRNVKLDRAEEMSKKSNELERDNASYNDTYGWILFAQGKYAEAKLWLEKAVANGASNNAVILEHLGDVEYKLNNSQAALDYWIKAKKAGAGSDILDRKINEKRLIE